MDNALITNDIDLYKLHVNDWLVKTWHMYVFMSMFKESLSDSIAS